MADGNPDPRIGGILPQDRAQALELALSHLRPDDRRRHIDEALAHGGKRGTGSLCRIAARPTDHASHGARRRPVLHTKRTCPPFSSDPFEGLISARRNGRLAGAVFSQIESGKTAVVWLPRLVAGEPESTAAGLFAATWEFLTRRQVVLAQVLLPRVDRVERARLRLGGFRRLADLLYLVSAESAFPAAPPATQLDFESYSAASHRRLAEIFEATCRGTLDCPGLEGARSAEDVLAGYRWAGVFDPRRWLIVRQKRRDVGCVLLADHPRHNNMELLYLGLIPAVRGHGWGRHLVRRAQQIARLAGRRRLVLAVDAANGPAVQTYMATGFQAWQRRRLYVRQLPLADNWHASFQQVIHGGRPRRGENSAAARMPG